jgi:quinolinate synthase
MSGEAIDAPGAPVTQTVPMPQPLQTIMPLAEWSTHEPVVARIAELKRQRDAIVLAHNYMTPEIFHGISDFAGDSLALAIEATRVPNKVIVQCGVHFMAETSKILNTGKTVLIPDTRAGCSLASSITAADIAGMRAQYPGAKVVSYVNTTAEVKAASDICCTSANALEVVEAMPGDTVIMTPDGFLARNVAAQSTKRIVWWEGTCMVHERFTPEELRAYRETNPGVVIIAHPECAPDVVAEADFSGSTGGMISWVRKNKPQKVVMVTECSMSDNVAAEVPETEFIRPCNICPHMKRITLENVLWSLHTMTEEVTVKEEHLEPARRAVEAMIALRERKH